MADVDAVLKELREQLHKAEAEVKEFNSLISRLELMGAAPTTIAPVRADRARREQQVAQLRRMMDAATPVATEQSQEKPAAFVQKAVATTRSELPEVMQRVKELRAAGKLKGRKQRLPLEDCYDLIKTSPRVKEVVADQFWKQVDKSEENGECWPVREAFKRNTAKNSLIKQVYIAALQCKLSAVRLAFILSGIDVTDDDGLRNTCGNVQCVKPAHNEGSSERKKPKSKEKANPMGEVVRLEEAEDYNQYIFELLNDQREDGQENSGILFREAEQLLVHIRQEIPSKDAMIKAVRLEKTGLNRFYLNPDKGRLYLTGYPRQVAH